MNLVRSWPQGQAGATPLGWSRPQPLMPPRIEGWPRGIVPSGNAEALLSTAVAYWDASKYRPGDRFLRNQGVAGELLDLRLGSSVVANTNDPLYLAPEQSGYVYLPGVSGNYLSVPDEAALDITGDIDIRVRVAMDDWTPAAASTLVSKRSNFSTQYAFVFDVNTTGVLRLGWSTGGDGNTTGVLASSTSDPSVNNGGSLWVRAVLDVDDGGVYKVYFYTSPANDGVNWTQLGNTVVGGAATSIFSSSAALAVGSSQANGTASLLSGRVYRAQVLNGIDGTTVLDIDCDAITSGSATSFTATTGQTVTINRSTSGRKSVAMPSRWNGGSPCFLLGTDDYFECVDNWQHQLLNFGQGDSFTVLAVVRQWATQIASGRWIDKHGASGPGYFLAPYSAFQTVYTFISDGTNTTSSEGFGPAFSYGSNAVISTVVDRSKRSVVSYSGSTIGASASTATVGSLSSGHRFRVGARSDSASNSRQDFEFRAAAIFRRALTAAEVTTLSTYWGS